MVDGLSMCVVVLLSRGMIDDRSRDYVVGECFWRREVCRVFVVEFVGGKRESEEGSTFFYPSIVRGGWWLVVGRRRLCGESSSNDAILQSGCLCVYDYRYSVCRSSFIISSSSVVIQRAKKPLKWLVGWFGEERSHYDHQLSNIRTSNLHVYP
jgi:hypothetical protein